MNIYESLIIVLITLFSFQFSTRIKKNKNRKIGMMALRDIKKQLPHQFLFVCHELSENPPHLLFKSILEMDEVLGEIRILASCVGYVYRHKKYGYEYSTFCLQRGEEVIHFQLCRQPPLSNSGGKAICMLRPYI